MELSGKVVKRMLMAAPFLAVGAAVIYLGYRMSPAVGDHSISLSQWRSQSKLGSAVSSLGAIPFVIGVFILWATSRTAFRQRAVQRHHEHGSDATRPLE